MVPIAAGILTIIMNYTGLLWETANVALWVGIGLIAAGFALATRWR